MKSGIYAIVSPTDGYYIGSAIDFGARFRTHRHLLRTGKHHNPALRRAAKKYGHQNLVFKKLIICRPCDVLEYEQKAIDALKPRYNAAPVAGSQLGFRHSEESKLRMAESRIGISYHTNQSRKAAHLRMLGNRFNVGRSLTEETKKRISEASKNKLHSDGFERRVTRKQKSEIVKLYLAGNGQPALASKWKTSHKVIRRILVAAGVVISPSGHSIKRRPQNGAMASQNGS